MHWSRYRSPAIPRGPVVSSGPACSVRICPMLRELNQTCNAFASFDWSILATSGCRIDSDPSHFARGIQFLPPLCIASGHQAHRALLLSGRQCAPIRDPAHCSIRVQYDWPQSIKLDWITNRAVANRWCAIFDRKRRLTTICRSHLYMKLVPSKFTNATSLAAAMCEARSPSDSFIIFKTLPMAIYRQLLLSLSVQNRLNVHTGL